MLAYDYAKNLGYKIASAQVRTDNLIIGSINIFTRKIILIRWGAVGYDCIQLVTISRPTAYGEYEPYNFVETKEEFEEVVSAM